MYCDLCRFTSDEMKALDVVLRVVVFPAATENTPVFTNMLCALDDISLDYYSLYLRTPYRDVTFRYVITQHMHLITQKASPLCIAVKYFIEGQASAAAWVLHVQGDVCVRACCIRWSAMTFCFSLRVVFCYIYVLRT